MTNPTFIIYGAASDVVASVFDYFENSNFICLVNSSKPNHLKGKILVTGSETFESDLKINLEKIDPENMLVFINAAIFQKDELFISHTKENINKMIQVGITQMSFISQIILSEMLKRRKGRLINLSSFRANAPAKGTVVYSAIKSFGNAFFNCLGLEYGRFDITSNSIAIGFAKSKLLDGIDDQKVREYKKNIAKNKLLPEREFCQAIEYVISSSYFNASVLDLNGGLGLMQ